MDEDQLAKKITAYHELAKVDKKIDIADLAISALAEHQENILPLKQKRWGYLVSLAAPPFGLIFAWKFYTSGKDDGEQSAWVCGILTAVGVLILVLFINILLPGNTASQIQQIKPSDIQQLIQ